MLKVNEYFDGKAKSISFETPTLPATVGVISPGEYEFGTSKKETMTVISGALTVMLPGMSEWMTYGAGEAFEVAGQASFKAKTDIDTAYLCTYE
ncbi:pyrimidine/purine nucleoside phosphorylase [Marinobacter xestospongiae]|uniref:Pyrimidine/purine nucleoside phosphorylase n=1 Tax=Marinobacter xestospongiae TaxID=994319 RepID=A0ABU3VUA8_9GAMM|nr:pyrimidine/purine nucleoside phosphorylase [Marinobacter xestospongiae]MCK7565396.1 pyrimidine/purine nucleoside phosphorylase [Marinobacter xestospongiae]MDV2077854.1 pyrimidine/purine nucleoside phosphorylase [Marinobacter xestospongiae]